MIFIKIGVLNLQRCKTIKWDDWINMGGHKKVQGTTVLKTNKEYIFNSILSELKDFTYCVDTCEFIKIDNNI
jgi:hypothetical protein